jgi:type I restriction enzyme, S subunit
MSAGWPSLPLKRVVDSVQSGTSVNGAPWPAQDDQLGVLKTSAVYGGVFTPTENKEVESYDLDRVSCPVLAGSLIVSRMNTPQHLGVAAAVSRDFPNLYLPDRLWAVTFSGAEPRFVDWWTKTAAYRAQVEAVCVGTSSSMQNISQGDFLEIRIELPNLETQRAIADYLDRETARIDTLIEEQQRLIEMLRERRVDLISHAVLDATSQRTQLRRLVDVIDCAHVTAEFVADDYRFPVASIRECQGATVDLSVCNYTTAEFFEHLRAGDRAPRAGDLLFIRNVSVGLVSVVAPDLPEFAMGQETVLLRRKSDVHPAFLRYALVGAEARHAIEGAMIGSTFRRINVSAIRSLPVPTPLIDEQRRIAAQLDQQTAKIDTLIAETERFIELSRERRAALITAAVTGQINVREMV